MRRAEARGGSSSPPLALHLGTFVFLVLRWPGTPCMPNSSSCHSAGTLPIARIDSLCAIRTNKGRWIQKVWNQIDKEFAKMIEQNEEEESRQTNPNLLNIEPIFHTMDRKLVEGPRLPETGLRSRNLCYSHSQDM